MRSSCQRSGSLFAPIAGTASCVTKCCLLAERISPTLSNAEFCQAFHCKNKRAAAFVAQEGEKKREPKENGAVTLQVPSDNVLLRFCVKLRSSEKRRQQPTVGRPRHLLSPLSPLVCRAQPWHAWPPKGKRGNVWLLWREGKENPPWDQIFQHV